LLYSKVSHTMTESGSTEQPDNSSALDQISLSTQAGTEKMASLLKKEPNLVIEDIVSSFNCNDTIIVCKSTQSGQLTKVPASSLMLSLASRFLRDVFGEVFERTLRVDDELLVIILPDFDEAVVHGMIECMATGDFECDNQDQYAQLDNLLTAVCLNRGHVDFTPRQSSQQMSLVEKDIFQGQNGLQMKTEPGLDSDIFEDPLYPNVKVEVDEEDVNRKANKRKRRKKAPVPIAPIPPEQIVQDHNGFYSLGDNFEEPGVKELSSDEDEFEPIGEPICEVKVMKKSKSIKLDDDESFDGPVKVRKKPGPMKAIKMCDIRKDKNNPCCPVCAFDGGDWEASVAHLEELLKEEGYKIPPVPPLAKGRHYCPICKRVSENMKRQRLHWKVHMEEAHNKQKQCPLHNETFENTSSYFAHLGEHKKLKALPNNLQKKECQFCHRTFSRQSWYLHKRSCERRNTNNYLMCDKCDFKSVTMDQIRRHYANMHGGDKPFKCPEPSCDKAFLR